MNGRPLTDAQISRALRAHLPDRAYPGLRERILDAAEATAQQRALPWFFGALSEADPVARRRSLLIAAALLVALALASAAAVGALRLLERDPIHELSLEPPADLPAFVLSSYERLPQLPPVALTWHDSSSAKGRIYVDRSGAVRFDRFMSADATQPSSYTILSRSHSLSGMAPVESVAVWVESDEEVFGEDPRVFLRTILGAADGPGCEMERDPSEVGSGTVATGWRYVGVEYVAGRPTHHVACVGELSVDIDLWLDIETRLILRTREPLTDDAGQPIPGQFRTTEVTEIAFGDQPAALFEQPESLTRMPTEAYDAYLCAHDPPDEERVGLGARSECPTSTEAEATPPPTPTPMPTVRPRPSGPAGPLAWSQARLTEDWPAPVRAEPDRATPVVPILLNVVRDADGCCKTREYGRYSDPTGDTGSDVLPWADIKEVTFCGSACLSINLVSQPPRAVDPTEQWIAYGVVADTDRDGVPDWRYGTDNMPVYATGDGPRRWWRTDLHTGRTEMMLRDLVWLPSGTMFYGGPERLVFGGNVTGERTVGGLPERFYAWASVIQDGRVVATDYAPDVGWLLPSPDAKPADVTQPEATNLLEDPFPVRLSMTVAQGWTTVQERRFYHAGSVIRDDGSTGLRWVMVDTVDKGACARRAGAVDGRATIDDLVAFLASLPLIDISKNTDVTFDGYRGTYLEFTRTAGEIDCGWGGLDGWPASSPSAIDEVDRVWILDVGGAPLVIDAFSSPGASDGVRAELRQIVDSIQIGPRPGSGR